jgi:hypothetical protein
MKPDFGNAWDDPLQNVFEAWLGGRRNGDGVAIASQSGGNP